MTNITMKIQFGTKETPFAVLHTFALGFILFGLVWYNSKLQYDLGKSQETVVQFRELNVTHSSPVFYCELPYDDCLCTVLWNKSNATETCITYDQFAVSRILPLISFALQIYLVRALFSLYTAHHRIVIYALWIAFVFIFITIAISIHRSSCFQVYITLILYFTGASIWLLTLRNLMNNRDNDTYLSNRDITATVYPSERTDEVARCW
jgi:hypothetical protein